MPKIAYEVKNFREASLRTIATANDIINELAADGFDLTLRQLYYQMVSRALIENSQRSYKNLGSLINDARMAGLIDWYSIVDRTRNLRSLSHFSSPGEILRVAARQYKLDKWATQPARPEVWVEKDALIGVVSQACNPLDVPYFSCRGYTSQSEMWNAAQRMKQWNHEKQAPVIIHLGDHDPSGIDMSRDIFDRLDLFTGDIEVKRIALNWDQVSEYNPPPNPAKLSDARARGYVKEFGYESWELDALPPNVIVSLIESTVASLRDEDAWGEIQAEEDKGKARLLKIANELG